MMIKMLSLFSGIGAFEKALSNIGEEFELVNYCEIDKYASKAYSMIHDVNESLNLGDITKIPKLTRSIDLITYGFPCQDISIAGKQAGFFDEAGNPTRSGLFFEALRIIRDTRPKFAIAENVKALTSKKFSKEFSTVLEALEDSGYKNYWSVLNAKDYGIPQNRERVFIISIRNDINKGFVFPKSYELTRKLKDMLEKNVDRKYFVTMDPYLYSNEGGSDYLCVKEATKKGYKEAYDGYYVSLQFPNSETRRGRVSEIAHTLMCNDMNGVIDHMMIRKLTPKECFRLMGFDDYDVDILIREGMSNAQLYKMAGNSIVVDVLEEIFVELLNTYEEEI